MKPLIARTAGLTAWIAGAAALISGCADPEGAYNDFADRWNATRGRLEGGTADGPVDAGPCVVAGPEDFNDDPYFFALSAGLLPKKPIVCLGTVTITQGANGPEISFNLQPLLSSDKRTPSSSPPIAGGPFPVNADGSFEADFGTINVKGDANPISGSDLESTVKLKGGPGAICKPANFVCGDVSGNVVKPLAYDLANGSKFTLQRVTDPNQYPAPAIDCAGTTP